MRAWASRQSITRLSGKENRFMPVSGALLGQRSQLGDGLFHGLGDVRFLLQEIEDLRSEPNGGIETRIRTRGVGAEINQVFGPLIFGERLSKFTRGFSLFGLRDAAREAADGIENIDGGIMAARAQF